jgi:hypothetical protein
VSEPAAFIVVPFQLLDPNRGDVLGHLRRVDQSSERVWGTILERCPRTDRLTEGGSRLPDR